MHQCVNNLYQRVNPGCADLALRLFVMCGEVADQTGFEEFSYEFFAQAFTIYEDSISDSRAQFQAVCIISGALHGSRGFSRENYDTLITKAALHGSKLLKKPDQCRAVYLASHLWWVIENPQRGEEDPKDVCFYRFLLISPVRKLIEFPALPRRQACSRMPSTSPPRGRRLHGYRCFRGALRRNPQPLRILLRPAKRKCDNKVFKRSDRAHPLKSPDRPGRPQSCPREPQETFLSYTGLYPHEGV